jgi:hypothetical protein
MRWILAGLAVALGACSVGPTVCGPARDIGGDGTKLSFIFTVCPADGGSVFVSNQFLQVLGPGGNTVSFWRDCQEDACALCDGGAACPTAAGIVEAFAEKDFKETWDGRLPAEASTCGGGRACLNPKVADGGTWRARFCLSTSAGRDGFGVPVALGPPLCAERPFEVPFKYSQIGVSLP